MFTSPQTNLALFEETAPTITLEEVEREFRDAWRGIEDPAIYFVNKAPLENTEAALKTALTKSCARLRWHLPNRATSALLPTPISERPVKSCPTNMSRMPTRIW